MTRYDAATATRGDAAKRALENAEKLKPNSSETLLALGYYQYRVLLDYGGAKTTLGRVGKMLPSNSEVPMALGLIAELRYLQPRIAAMESGSLCTQIHC